MTGFSTTKLLLIGAVGGFTAAALLLNEGKEIRAGRTINSPDDKEGR